MRRLALLAPITALALAAAGCGNEDANDNGSASNPGGAAMAKSEETTKAEAPAKPKGTRIKVVSSDYGRVIADGKGEAFYLFDKEDAGRAECYGACARAWPPVLTKGRPQAGGAAKQSLLGTTRRRDGKLQVTYAGQPLYYYVDDSPGTILCHDVAEFGGLWLVVKPNGKAAS